MSDENGDRWKPGAVQRSDICLTTERNTGKPQVGDHLKAGK